MNLKVDFSDLTDTKNLLGFSGGPDSVALFFLLLNAGIPFDIAIIDYQVREQSKEEVKYAKFLANTYKKEIFIFQSPRFFGNFENQARKIRYHFFEQIIKEKKYDCLILAHQLNDRLEWFLMQLTKGASLGTLLGFERVEARESYKIIRPMWEITKDEILYFLENQIQKKYFLDASNQDLSFLRNKIRNYFSNPLIQENKNGILKTFQLLTQEKQKLYPKIKIQKIKGIFYFFSQNTHLNLYYIDKILKQLGYIMSQKQREEILKQRYCMILGKQFIIDRNEKFIFIAQKNHTQTTITKAFKNLSRKLNIPCKIRPIFFNLIQMGALSESDLKDIFN